MKKIIYYITDHGKGHATRSVAIIRELKKKNIELIIRNSNSEKFLNQSLPTIKIISGLTDVGPSIKNDGISINQDQSKPLLHNWIHKLENFALDEIEIIKKFQPNLIISDISAMPFLAAKKTNVDSIAISNFSWYDVLKFLSSEDLELLKNSYENANLAFKLLIGTSMSHFKNLKEIGIVSRVPLRCREDIRKELGIKKNEKLVSIAMSVTLEGKFHFEENIKILSMNSVIKNCQNVIAMPQEIESQDIVNASDFVICKCGYGMISECLTNGIPFYYVSDDNHLEQKAMTQELSGYSLAKRTTLVEIRNLNFNQKFIDNLPVEDKMPRYNETIIKHIMEYLKN